MSGPAPRPGWHAIDQAFAAVYDAAQRDVRAPAESGVLSAISAYRSEDHWHLVTFGLTDLDERTGGDRSGFGHELTLITPASERAPDWAFELLMGTAKVCVTHSRPLHAGARLAPGAPIDGARSELVALGVREDPLVAPRQFPFGDFAFLQLVGVTDVGYRLMQRVGTLVVLEKMAARDPLLRTDVSRHRR